MKKDPQTVKHCPTSVQSKWGTPEIILSLLLISPTSNFISVDLLTANSQFYQLLLPLHTKYPKTVFPSVLGDEHSFFSNGTQHLVHGRRTNIYVLTQTGVLCLLISISNLMKITRKLQTDLMFLFYYLYVFGIDDHINTHVRL